MNKQRLAHVPGRLAAALFCLLLPATLGAVEIPGLAVLEHGGVILGVKLDAGGRAVYLGLSRPGGAADAAKGEGGALPPNALYGPAQLWTVAPPAADAKTANSWTTWKPFQGHITWIGPQKDFWARQDLVPEKRDAHDEWPPDPYVVYGRCEIVEKSDAHLVVQGPASPVSGVRLRKEYRIGDDGRLTVRVAATNVLDRPNALNLWSNTRVPSHRFCLVKIPNQRLEFSYGTWEPYNERPLPWAVHDGWFHFVPGRPETLPAGIKEMSGKVAVNPPQGLIVVGGDGMVFVKRFATVAGRDLAPGQGAVEVYHCVSKDPTRGMAELEFYNAYRTLAPGEGMEIVETWELRPYSGPDTLEGYLQWARENVKE